MNSKPWCTPADYLELLRDDGVADFLHVAAHTPFLVEIAFLNHWNTTLDRAPQRYGIEEIYAFREADQVIVQLTYQDPDEPASDDIDFIYIVDPDTPGRHALDIIHNGQLIYSRRAWQDPATDWEINEMANDPFITDQDGNTLFVGDPVNI